MRTCLITTTIYVPTVLCLYRQASKDITFIVAGDKKTPDDEVRTLCDELGNTVYLNAEDQEELGYECSDAIGWNCIMRRNIALLEAIKLKPNVIVTIDDDNIPLMPHFYFRALSLRLEWSFSGPMASEPNGWFNVGGLFDPPFVHRGFPYSEDPHAFVVKPAANREIGVVVGMWYGDPDVNAVERMASAPVVTTMPGVLESGVIVGGHCFAPFNSQNTAYTYELAPLMPVLPAVGRYDDIWTSYIAQRIMWEHDQHVFYGQPFVYQERNPQSTMRNLKDEIYGMEYTGQFCGDLRQMKLGNGSPVEMLARVYEQMQGLDYLPDRLKRFCRAWIKDLDRVL